MRLVRDAVDQRFAESRVGNDFRPFRKGQVCRKNDRCFFRSIRDDLEEKLRADLGHWHIADFVNRNHVVTRPAFECATEHVLMLCFDEFVDEARSSRKAHAALLPAGGHTQRSKQMRFASAAIADEEHWLGAFNVSALGQLFQLTRRDMRCCAERNSSSVFTFGKCASLRRR